MRVKCDRNLCFTFTCSVAILQCETHQIGSNKRQQKKIQLIKEENNAKSEISPNSRVRNISSDKCEKLNVMKSSQHVHDISL